MKISRTLQMILGVGLLLVALIWGSARSKSSGMGRLGGSAEWRGASASGNASKSGPRPPSKSSRVHDLDQKLTFQPRYLRGHDHLLLEALVEPLLTPNVGRVHVDPETLVITVYDNRDVQASIGGFLAAIDKPRGRVTMGVQVVRLSKSGADAWNARLGEPEDGGSSDLTEARSTVALFADSALIGEVLRSLGEGGEVEQVDDQILTTEDNEMARGSLSLRDTSQGLGESKSLIAVTPSLLSDSTIRMKVHFGYAEGAQDGGAIRDTGEVSDYVSESIARVPSGHSLIVRDPFGTNVDEGSELILIVTPTPLPPAEEAL